MKIEKKLKSLSKLSKSFSKYLNKRWKSDHLLLVLESFVFLVVLVSVLLLASNIRNVQQGRSSASTNLVDYNISVPAREYKHGDTFSATITVNPNTNKVSAADLFITYDTSHLQLISAASIAPLKDLISESKQTGVHRLAFVVECKQEGCTTIQHQQDIVQISFKILNQGTSQISLDKSQTLTAEIGTDNQTVTGDITPASISSSTGVPCTKNGDTNDDGKVDGADYTLFLDNWGKSVPPGDERADFNCNGAVEGLDYVVLFDNWTANDSLPTPTPNGSDNPHTPPPQDSPPPSDPPPSNNPPPSVPPPPDPSAGVWLNPDEIMALPMSGSGWSHVQSEASGSWGSAKLSDNNSSHDVKTLAGALVAVRTGDEAMRQKTIEGLHSAMNSGLARALELSRGLQTYIIAADIIGYRDPAFQQWVRDMIFADVSGHSCSGPGVHCTAVSSANNWGGHARASLAAAAIYLDDAQLKEDSVNAQKEFIGIGTTNKMNFTGTNWHAGSPQAGVNVKGATIDGVNVSGVLPEDWRRAAGFKWPPSTSGYMWEGMQGHVVAAAILHRAGLLSFSAGDNAIVRSMDMLYGMGEAASNSPVYKNTPSGDDAWIPALVNFYAGTNYPEGGSSTGKGMGYTDWTH